MKIRGGILLAQALQQKGITQVFTLSGGFCNPVLEGCMQCGIPVINSPHEQVAGHLADGFTRLTRKPTVCLVGPEGFANAVPAMMEAWGERSPVLFITGSSTLKRQGSGGFKEIDDVAIAAPLTKYSAAVTDGTRIAEFVDRAYKIAVSGYPGPVHLSVPVDLLFSAFDAAPEPQERPFDHRARPPARAWPEPAAFDAVYALLRAAARPILIVGHGIWWSGSEQQLAHTARQLRIPVFNIPYHQKLLDQQCEVNLGLADVHQYAPSKYALQNSDLVLMVGGRLDNQMNFGNPPLFPADGKLICINGSHEELEHNRAADQILLCDPGALFELLTARAEADHWQPDDSWLQTNQRQRHHWIEQTLREIPDTAAGKLHPLRLALGVQSMISAGDCLVFDGGNTHFWSEIALNISASRGIRPASVLHPGAFSMLGVGIPFGIAAKRQNPQRNVIVLSGDGAFLSGGLSIEAAFQENLPIVVVIDNNGGLDCISQQQERLFANGRHCATDFRDIPFDKLFAGLGGHGELVESMAQLQPALRRAIDSGKTACVNVKTEGHISPIVLATTHKRDKASIE